VGASDGDCVGEKDGAKLGLSVGINVGDIVGAAAKTPTFDWGRNARLTSK
jgi:hypothetical protein